MSAYVDAGQSARGRGNSGTDLNAIPEDAIDHIEILRDGASAQYGSDAIAGVINIVLKKDINHLTFDAGFSGYDDHKYNTLSFPDPNAYYTGKKFDGQTLTLGADYGIAIGKNGGFLNIGGNYEGQCTTWKCQLKGLIPCFILSAVIITNTRRYMPIPAAGIMMTDFVPTQQSSLPTLQRATWFLYRV